MEKKLTNSGPSREPADKHSIYTLDFVGVQGRSSLRDDPALQRRFMAVARFSP